MSGGVKDVTKTDRHCLLTDIVTMPEQASTKRLNTIAPEHAMLTSRSSRTGRVLPCTPFRSPQPPAAGGCPCPAASPPAAGSQSSKLKTSPSCVSAAALARQLMVRAKGRQTILQPRASCVSSYLEQTMPARDITSAMAKCCSFPEESLSSSRKRDKKNHRKEKNRQGCACSRRAPARTTTPVVPSPISWSCDRDSSTSSFAIWLSTSI